MLAVASVLPESTTMISSAMSFTLFSVRLMFASSLSVMMQTERLMRGRITGAESAGHALSMSAAEATAGSNGEIKGCQQVSIANTASRSSTQNCWF
jgi:hypothetical protein